LLFPPVLWVTSRCRPVCVAAGVFTVSLMIMTTVTLEIGNFGDGIPSMDADIVSAQITIAGMALVAFVLSALFTERRQYEEQQQFLLAELDHRAKNVLARVAAVADSTHLGGGSNDEFIISFKRRIQSMAAAHTLLSHTRWRGIDLAALVRSQLAPYPTDANMTIVGIDTMLDAPTSQALAMVLHELVTNAAKYGALSTPGGRVSVSWERKPSGAVMNLILVWREAGGPAVASKVQSSYGIDLIRNLIPHELGGRVDLALPKEGVNCRIEIPLKQA
jgi:two-component sensor histidine kinase